jgi:Zn-finger nucleic acid-binding protein
VEIDQCSQCGGVWLDQGELETILETSRKGNTPNSEISSGVQLNAGISNDAKKDKIPCPFCSKTLNVVNFAYDSGVIINRCPDHGIWLDSGELKRIEDNRAFWRAESAKRESEWKQHLNPSSSTSAQTNQTLLDFFRSIFF